MCMAASVAFNISKEKTKKDSMKAFAKLYEKPSSSYKIFVIKRLFNMNMLEGGFVVNHTNGFNTVNDQLNYIGVNFDDEIRALIILCSFSKSLNDLFMVECNSLSLWFKHSKI
jgi:hypothetical protein